MALSSYGYASAQVAVAPVVIPHASANRVSYGYGPLREWYANGPLGLEQGFDVARPPRSGSGTLTLSLALSGGLLPRLRNGSLLLSGHGTALRYGGLVASDAHGRALRTWLSLGGGRVLIHVDDRSARYPLRIDPLIQQAELTASEGAKKEQLGYSVAISGNTIVAGAPFRGSGPEAHQGAVYVYTMPTSGWAGATQAARLTVLGAVAGEELGYSVAISGDTIAAGAPGQEVAGRSKQGAVYVFTMPNTGWSGSLTQTAELTASDGRLKDELGRSVALSGDSVIAGAPFHGVAGNPEQGALYAFTMPDTGWSGSLTQTAELTASDGGEVDFLGWSLAAAGETVVAGAPNHVVAGGTEQGSVYVFAMPPSGWEDANQTAELSASDGERNDKLGYSVAISGNTVVAGAPGRKLDSHEDQGAAYVFVMPPTGWADATETAELTAAEGGEGDWLGNSVAAAGETIVAGAPFHEAAEHANQGAAYVFTMPQSGWISATQSAELNATDGVSDDFFGWSLAGAGEVILLGSPQHMVEENVEQGAAYVFGPEPAAMESPPPGEPPTQTTTQTTTTQTSGSGGSARAETATGPVSSPPAAPPSAAAATPLLAALSQTAKRWREGHALARFATPRERLPVGTTFSFTLNMPAAVTFTFTRQSDGRMVAGKCVAPTRKDVSMRRCARTVTAGELTFSAHAGVNKVRFDGVASKRMRLGSGTYTLLATATAAGQRSTTQTLRFTIA